MADEYIPREEAIVETCHGCSFEFSNEPCEPCDCEIMVRLKAIPAADVVARDCYDRLLAENDELRKERPVVRCGECYYWKESSAITHIGNCKYMRRLHTGRFFCGNGTRKDGDGE